MLQFKNGRCHAYGISFQFPEGFYLDSAPELEHECGIVALGPNEDYQVAWDFVEEDYDPQEVLQRFFAPGNGMVPMTAVEPLVLGGLAGYSVTYHSGRIEYFEARFSVEDDMQFILLISTGESKIQGALASPEVQTLLKDIRTN